MDGVWRRDAIFLSSLGKMLATSDIVFERVRVVNFWQQIQTWSFDTRILARLAAVLHSAEAILLSRVIRNLLHF